MLKSQPIAIRILAISLFAAGFLTIGPIAQAQSPQRVIIDTTPAPTMP